MRRLKLPFTLFPKSVGKSDTLPKQKSRLSVRRVFLGSLLLSILTIGTGVYLRRKPHSKQNS